MTYIRYDSNFIELFDQFIEVLADYKNLQEKYELPLITDYIWDLTFVDVEDADVNNILEIVEQINNGDKDYLKRFAEVKDYLSFINSSLKYKHECRRDWRYRCPELHSDVYGIEDKLLWILEDLLIFVEETPLNELFHVMTANETIGLTSVCRQCKLPIDIQYYVSDYIGIW